MAKMSEKRIRPALTPEGRESQMISLAVDLAEKQLREGTASSQVISHYLKMSSSKEKVELEKLKLEKELIQAKTDNVRSQQKSEKMYAEVIEAMRKYSGADNE